MFGKKKEKNTPVKKPVVKNKNLFNNEKVTPLEMYDDLLANINSRDYYFDTDADVLDLEHLTLDFGKILSRKSVMKLFVVNDIDTWIHKEALQRIKNYTTSGLYSVKLNYIIDLNHHQINWDDPYMKQTLASWNKRFETDEKAADRDNVFKQRELFGETVGMQNKKNSFEYFNRTDLKYRRTLFKANVIFLLVGDRKNAAEYRQAILQLKSSCAAEGFKCIEAEADIYNWLKSGLPTSLQNASNKVPRKIMSDDTVTSMLSIGQGIMGKKGIPLGIDINSGLPVFHVFREDKTSAENILVSAGTGGGKSVFTKNIITWALKENISVMVLDYEGDEYTNLAHYINSGNPNDAVIVNLNAGSGRYFDPLRIADLTGNEDIDRDAKVQSINFTKAMMTILMGEKQLDGTTGLSLEEDSLISEIISRIHAEHLITDNPKTWAKSKDLKIDMIYTMLCKNIENRVWNKPNDDSLHKVAERMQLKLKKYFVKGESEYGTFGEVLELSDLRDARFIVFSFGNKGADQQGANEVKIALKQLCVSKVANELSNYNWSVKNGKFTLKVWEEVQRFINIKGAEDIMRNCITGGRKRGDISIIITNDLAQILDGEAGFAKTLKNNLTGYCIGYIPSNDIREKFCETFGLQLLKPALDRIFQETSSTMTEQNADGTQKISPYRKAFMVKLDATSQTPAIQAIVKAAVSPAILGSKVFDVGQIETDKIS